MVIPSLRHGDQAGKEKPASLLRAEWRVKVMRDAGKLHSTSLFRANC